MRRCFVCNSFITLSETCCVCPLASAHCFLAETVTSLVPAHMGRWYPCQSFPLWILVLCVHMSACVRLWHGHLKTCHFLPVDKCRQLVHGNNHLVAGHMLFLPPPLNSLSCRLWHCTDISGIPRSPDKSCLTIISTDFMQCDYLSWTAAHYSELHQWTQSQSKQMWNTPGQVLAAQETVAS